jgi:HAD superfamily hydrolase (TIGR01509 family)
MGRHTFVSLPGVLDGRKHIVATRDEAFVCPPGVETARDLKAVLQRYADVPEEVFVIGGADVCAQALPFCETLYLTRVLTDFEGDAFFADPPENFFALSEQTEIFTDSVSGLRYRREIWKRRLRLVIFDMDGLMFDTERLSMASWSEAGAELGLTVPQGFWYSLMGSNDNGLRERISSAFGAEIFPTLHARHDAIMEQKLIDEGIRPMDGLQELLSFLKNHGIKRAVATGSLRGKAERYLSATHLTSFLNAIIAGDMVERGKPDPDIYLKTLAEFALAPENALVLEDSKNGLLSATAAGIRCVLVPDQVPPDAESLSKAFAIVKNLREVKDLLKDGIV